MTSAASMRAAPAALVLLALCACSGLRSEAPATQAYVLRPAPAVQAGAPAAPVPGLLVLRRPEVQPGLETARIALLLPGNRLDYFAASRWSASLPQVIDAFATQSLLAAGRFELVNGSDRGTAGARFLLLLTVRHFEADYGRGEQQAPDVRVAFECVLVEAATRVAVGRCDGEAVVPAAANRMEPIVMAFEAAAREAMGEVGEQAARLADANVRMTTSPSPR
jgi:ABC-type uncharacterized transport system auxiliary subunit